VIFLLFHQVEGEALLAILADFGLVESLYKSNTNDYWKGIS
jgi:hypothetical protein